MKFSAENLCVNRGIRTIIKDVSFALEAGEALIILGENGSGKSTLLRAIAGLLPISSGKLSLTQIEDDTAIYEQCHYLGHKNGMKDALSVQENLSFWQSYNGVLDANIENALATVDMGHVADVPFGYLSTGMKRRVSICKLLLNKRPVWIVDEPTSGLDLPSAKLFEELCNRFCRGGGILIAATHLPLGIKKSKELKLKKHSSFFDDSFLAEGPAT